MKAKAYAVQFLAVPPQQQEDECNTILALFLDETQALVKLRRCATLETYANVVRELDAKYRAYVSLVNAYQPGLLNPNDYKDLIRHDWREVWQVAFRPVVPVNYNFSGG